MIGEWIVVAAVVALAVGYLAWSFGKAVRGSREKSPCAACPSRERRPA